MKCPKCKGLMVYEPPTYEGEQGSARCMICGNRIWEPRTVVMPEVPTQEKERPGAPTTLEAARAAKHNQTLLEGARIEREARLAVA